MEDRRQVKGCRSRCRRLRVPHVISPGPTPDFRCRGGGRLCASAGACLNDRFHLKRAPLSVLRVSEAVEPLHEGTVGWGRLYPRTASRRGGARAADSCSSLLSFRRTALGGTQ